MVMVKLLRGDIHANGIDELQIDLGQGNVFLQEVSSLQLRLGRGNVYGYLPRGSTNRIDIAVGDVDLQQAT